MAATSSVIREQPLGERTLTPIRSHAAGHEHLAEVPILVLANKKDLRDAMTASELTTALALTDVKVRRHHKGRTRICLCTALSAAELTL